jgi:N-acetylglucosaminyl-diphospho-decaprenol L-rhamnosyltransferase
MEKHGCVEPYHNPRMTEPFKHVIITRYFTRHSLNASDFEVRLGDVSGWLEERLILFKKYCLPSVIGQSEQNFTWLLYLDETTPTDYLRKIQDLIAGHDNFKVRMSRFLSIDDHVADVRAELQSDTRWVLTSRLDNDDGLHRDFIKNLQGQCRSEREFLNFPSGIIYYRDHTYLFRHRSNAFVSFCEPTDSLSTVICSKHLLVDQVAPLRQLTSPPAFLQVVHGNNRSNKPRGTRVHRMLALNGFEAIPELFTKTIEESDARITLENVTLAASWRLRDKLIQVARSIKHRSL